MQNVFLWIKNDQRGGYKFRYSSNQEFINAHLKLQIENSLRLGWDKKDIVAITNFQFEYMGVKSHIATDICRWSSFANKMVVINEMIKAGVINNNFWLHDCDAYQLIPFEFPKECKDVGFTRHAPGRTKPQGGSAFYRKEAYDIIQAISDGIKLFKAKKEESFFPCFYYKTYKIKLVEKYKAAITKLEKLNNKKYEAKIKFYTDIRDFVSKYFGEFEDRFSWLNWTYDLFRQGQFSRKYPSAEKPIKVVHFHVEYPSCLNCFYYGINNYKVKIVTPELRELLLKYKLVKE
jgi:hypothetical protein